jgi:hypothetical protein
MITHLVVVRVLPVGGSARRSPPFSGAVTSIKGQTATTEDTANRGDLVRAVVKCCVCELLVALQLLLVAIRKCSIIHLPIETPSISTPYLYNIIIYTAR